MGEPLQSRGASGPPYLEHYPRPGGPARRVLVDPLPFRLGRSPSAQFIVPMRQVSKEHAEIIQTGEQYRIRDLKSTNGTFVNGQRVAEAGLSDGDIIHIAHMEFRFGHQAGSADGSAHESFTDQAESRLPPSLIRAYAHLREMLANGSCSVSFQPILAFDTAHLIGYEALGRGTHDGLTSNPSELFRLAEQCGLAVDLSRMFRAIAVAEAAYLADSAYVFLNLHPQEIHDPGLLAALRELPERAGPGQQLVLDVNESVVADIASLQRLRHGLKELGIGLAYDDFGAGQARLAELVEAPPDFIKLDMSLVRGIHLERPRQQLVRALCEVISNLGGIKIIAKGIETQDEADLCRQLGCDYCQGFLYGRPQALPTPTRAGGSAPGTAYHPPASRRRRTL